MTTTGESQTARPIPTGIAVTNLDPAFREDPHPVLDDLRERDPAHHDALMGSWFLTRQADVQPLLQNRDLAVDPRKANENSMIRRLAGDQLDDGNASMLFLDPPDHDRLRGLVNKAFTPRAVEAMAPRIQEIADQLLDRLAGRAEFDVIADYSAPLPTIVIAEMLGIDPADQAQFKIWSDQIVKSLNPFISAEERTLVQQADQEFGAYLVAAVEERRRDRRADLITGLIEAEEGGQQLTNDEIVTMVGLLLAAGNVTTTDLIGNGVLALLQNPEQLRLLREDPSLIKNAVEEMLRYDPPVMQTGRIATGDIDIAPGCPVHKGESIGLSLSASNHDPAVHPDPHRFDIQREDVQHVSFGGGRRYCLGAPLARLEAQIGVGALVQRFPGLRLDPAAKIEHRGMPVFRGLLRLPVLT